MIYSDSPDLCDIYEVHLTENSLPKMSADELIHEYGMTMPKTQYEWIVNFLIYGRKSKMPINDPKVKILEVKDNSFDIYELLSRRDRATINEIILETIASKRL